VHCDSGSNLYLMTIPVVIVEFNKFELITGLAPYTSREASTVYPHPAASRKVIYIYIIYVLVKTFQCSQDSYCP
jgi:hypothetical protein